MVEEQQPSYILWFLQVFKKEVVQIMKFWNYPHRKEDLHSVLTGDLGGHWSQGMLKFWTQYPIKWHIRC